MSLAKFILGLCLVPPLAWSTPLYEESFISPPGQFPANHAVTLV